MVMKTRSSPTGVRYWIAVFGVGALLAMGIGLARIAISGAWHRVETRHLVLSALVLVLGLLAAGASAGMLARFATSVWRAMVIGALIATPFAIVVDLLFFDYPIRKTLLIGAVLGPALGALYAALLYSPDG
jgi:hypothetical protein